MAEGNNNLRIIVISYSIGGGLAILLRLCLQLLYLSNRSPMTREESEFEKGKPLLYRTKRSPFVLFCILLLFITISLPPYPWRHLTATLPYDLVLALSTLIMSKALHGHTRGDLCYGNSTSLGDLPLGTTNYNPIDDPYYVTNLDESIDGFFLSALEDVKFTNIVHIVLESMRDDSFPFDEEGLLNQHIKNDLTPVEGGTPVNTQTITPFISSLAEHTISWHTMWSTIPYTHKAMLSCNSPSNRH